MDITMCFRTLGISGHEDMSAIKKAFLKVALKYHPDKTKNDVNLLQRFIEARNAYDSIIKFKKAIK